MEVDSRQRKLLKDVFGGSSSSDSENEEMKESPSSPHHLPTPNKHGLVHVSPSTTNPSLSWERIPEILGLWVFRNFLSPQQQSSLLSSIQDEGCFTEAAHNQAMRFGNLPFWALELSEQIHDMVCFGDKEAKLIAESELYVLPPQLLSRDPFFDQLIINVYQPGEGICAHVDLMQFEDGIAVVSLESSCVMQFSPVGANGEALIAMAPIPVYLTPGSLLILWGDARYNWKHEINRKPGFQVWQGQELVQKRRTSITLRKLCNS